MAARHLGRGGLKSAWLHLGGCADLAINGRERCAMSRGATLKCRRPVSLAGYQLPAAGLPPALIAELVSNLMIVEKLTLPLTGHVARRGLLRAFAMLAPAAALTVVSAPVSAAAGLKAPEDARLLWLGKQLDQVEAEFTAALERKKRCRSIAEGLLPEPPASIVFLPGQHPPHWCGVEPEYDVDGKIIYWNADPGFRRPRKIAFSAHLEHFLEFADQRTKDARAAKRMLNLARNYETARDQALAKSGFLDASDQAFRLYQRIDRIAGLIYKSKCHSFEGLAIKAQAMLAAIKADVVEDSIAHRSKVLYAAKLANEVMALKGAV